MMNHSSKTISNLHDQMIGLGPPITSLHNNMAWDFHGTAFWTTGRPGWLWMSGGLWVYQIPTMEYPLTKDHGAILGELNSIVF